MQIRPIFWAGLLVLAACATAPTSQPVSRSQSIGWAAGDVKVSVPARLSLSVGAAPQRGSDIAWQGAISGAPKLFVGRIVEDGALRAVGHLTGARRVILAVEVQSFQSLGEGSETVLHLQAFDALTGRSVSPPAELRTDIGTGEVGAARAEEIARKIEADLVRWMGMELS